MRNMTAIRVKMFEERGMAMIAVIGVMALATIVIFGMAWYSEQVLNQAGIVRNNTQAYQIASSGIDTVLARIQANGFNPDEYPLTGVINGGTYSVVVIPEGDINYRVTSTGTTQSGASESIVVKIFYMNLWNMNFAAGSNQSLTAGGGGINGTSNVTGPFYVRGTIQMGGNSCIHGGPLFVKDGDIVLTGNAEIGESTKPIDVYVTGKYPTTLSLIHI